MNTPHALISGASSACFSAAWWLRRIGWEVTIIECAPEFRDGGHSVDIRRVARDVLDRMALTEAVRARNTTETGTVIVDKDGEVIAEMPSDGPGEATAELEVLRGAFTRAMLDALPDGVRLIYGVSITAADESGEDLGSVRTAGGHTIEADLFVVAEGVRTSTRDMLFASSEIER